ncbi:hypothetical protein DXG01_012411, partial [Tephrocybe rancida]
FGWTQTHGFFIIMGGFQACHSNGTTPPFTLVPDDISTCLENHDITISEQDIQDKSKGDLLGKSLVLLQVTWFILQTIARAVRHLGITEIELATLAFAILNFFTYFCWRNKPLDVSLPLQVTADYLYTRAAHRNRILRDIRPFYTGTRNVPLVLLCGSETARIGTGG